MEQKTTEDKLKEYKKHSGNCALCGKQTLFDGCSINLVAISETGQVIAPYNNEFQGMSSILPLCSYHFVLAQEGLIAITTQGQIIQIKLLTQLEPQTDEDLNKFILKIGRAKKDELNTAYKKVAKTIINARKFQIDTEKGVEEAKKIDVDFIYNNENVILIDSKPKVEIKQETDREKKNRYFREYYHRVTKEKLKEGK